MKVLLVSPLGFPVNESTKYAGIEKLVWGYSKELSKHHQVTVIGHYQSIFPAGVTLLKSKSIPQIDSEITTFQTYQYLFRTFDVIHDFSHLHLSSRFMPNLPSLNIFWHAPALAKYPKSPYNIIALSQWAEREFQRIYRQKARFQQSIVIDPEIYKPEGVHGDRFLTIGRMAPEKGNLNAIMLCRDMGVPLDVVGGRGAEKTADTPLDEYETTIHNLCDGEKIRFRGEVTDEEKIKLMQSCRGLIYCTDHPEVTNHKIFEALLCGAPIITTAVGSAPEWFTNGIEGYHCMTDREYIEAIKNVDKLNPLSTRDKTVERFSPQSVIASYIPLYEAVAGGERW